VATILIIIQRISSLVFCRVADLRQTPLPAASVLKACRCLVWKLEDKPRETQKSLMSTFNKKLCPAIAGGPPALLVSATAY